MAQQQITCATGALGSDGSLDAYDVPGAVLITPYSVSAIVDGGGAAGAFLPCLTLKTQTGAIIARCPAPEVAAGDSAEVSWFPHVAQQTSAGIQFDTDPQVGDWLVVETTGSGTGPTGGYAVHFKDDPGGGGFRFDEEGDGGISFIDTGPGGTLFQDGGGGGIEYIEGGGGGITFDCSSGGGAIALNSSNEVHLVGGDVRISLTGTTNLIVQGLPTSDPGVSGALYSVLGVVHVSP